MTTKYKIAIFGIGGIGGFVGGKLVSQFVNSDVEVAFITRGENEIAIRSKGLLLTTYLGQEIVHPSIVTSHPEAAGEADLIICCTKSYDLESIETLKPCVGSNTSILQLLNGVDTSERIRKIFPQAEIWDGCIYIVSRLTTPGVVKVTGNTHSLFFGSEHAPFNKLKFAETIFRSAGINASISDNISRTIWEKFLFISPLAALTSYYDESIGAIVGNLNHKNLLLNLFSELKNIADAKSISLPAGIIQKHMEKITSLPYESTSSMHSDFKRGGKTELESLTGYVVRQGKELNIPTPDYEKIYASLLLRSGINSGLGIE